MKKLFALLIIGILSIGCSSDSDSDGGAVLSDTPTAKEQFDTSNLGFYKGVFTGSSGVIKINIMNDGALNATLVLDGAVYEFTTTETASATGDISGLTFTSGTMSFDLNISQNGDNVEATNLNFPEHPEATLNILKEYSWAVLKCYQGSHTQTDGGSTGVLNVMINDGYVSGLAYIPGDENGADFLNGSEAENILTGTFGEGIDGGSFNGTVSGNNISGQWQSTNPQGPSGTWTCSRTL